MKAAHKFYFFTQHCKMSTGIINISSTLSEPPQTRPLGASQLLSNLQAFLEKWSAWQYIVMFLAGLIVYDQGTYERQVYEIRRLTPFLVIYLKRKGSIAGPAFKIPLIGPFTQAIHPKFDSYLAQWASGPLSCVSIFHKYAS
jgi:C-22 sterol desaturase